MYVYIVILTNHSDMGALVLRLCGCKGPLRPFISPFFFFFDRQELEGRSEVTTVLHAYFSRSLLLK